jgi:hypothetical protein
VLILLLTLNCVLVYFWNAIWLFYQLFIHVCSEANVRKKISAYFPPFFSFYCEASKRTCSCVWTCSALSISYLTACRPDKYVPRSDVSFLFFLPNTHTTFCLFYNVMLCVFSLGLIPRFWHSLHIFSHSQVFPLTFLILLRFGSF